MMASMPEILLQKSKEILEEFCNSNELDVPVLNIHPVKGWAFGVPAYYRPQTGVNICLPRCTRPASNAAFRCWSWPGSKIDKTIIGVVAHEIGHHADCQRSEKMLGPYWGNLSHDIVLESADKRPITNYDTHKPHEVFAEWFRLFITNPNLLKILRPNAYDQIRMRFTPIENREWLLVLGSDCPARIVLSLENAMK